MLNSILTVYLWASHKRSERGVLTLGWEGSVDSSGRLFSFIRTLLQAAGVRFLRHRDPTRDPCCCNLVLQFRRRAEFHDGFPPAFFSVFYPSLAIVSSSKRDSVLLAALMDRKICSRRLLMVEVGDHVVLLPTRQRKRGLKSTGRWQQVKAWA
jgi:hypothetical protein